MDTIKVEKDKGGRSDANSGISADSTLDLQIDRWFDEEKGEVDAFRLFNKIESIKSAHREQQIAENVKRARKKEMKEFLPNEEHENLLESSSRTVCVSNLPKYVNEAQLRQMFHELSVGMKMSEWINGAYMEGRYGAMLDAQEQGEGILSQAITRVKIIRGAIGSTEENECIGYAFVEFETAAHAKAVIDKAAVCGGLRPLPKATNDPDTMEKDVMAKISWGTTATRAPLDLYQIYIANTPESWDEFTVLHRLREILNRQDIDSSINGSVLVSVDCMKDPVSDNRLGFGFLRVKSDGLHQFWKVYESVEMTDKWIWKSDTVEKDKNESKTKEEVEENKEENKTEGKRVKRKKEIIDRLNRLEKVKEKLAMKGNSIFLKKSYQRPSTSRIQGDAGTAEAIANTTLFMANITPAILEHELKEILIPFGPIVSFRMARMKNLAFVTYAYAMSALAALTHLNGVEMKGQRLHLSYGYSRFAVPKHIREELAVDHYASKDDEAFGLWKKNTLIPPKEGESMEAFNQRIIEFNARENIVDDVDGTETDGSIIKEEQRPDQKSVKRQALENLINML